MDGHTGLFTIALDYIREIFCSYGSRNSSMRKSSKIVDYFSDGNSATMVAEQKFATLDAM